MIILANTNDFVHKSTLFLFLPEVPAMQYKGSKFKNPWQKKPARPLRLAFGLVEPKSSEENLQKPLIQEFPAFEKLKIVGTLIVKKINLNKVPPLPQKYVLRVLRNLKKIYDAGLYLKTNSIIDIEEGNETDVLKVAFSFNQTVIDRMRGLDRNERQWDPENKVWRVFVGCFDDVFDFLGPNVKLTLPAFQAIQNFIQSPYYAKIARSVYGKLLVRESWYKQMSLGEIQTTEVDLQKIKEIRKEIKNFNFKRKPYSHQLTGIEFLMQRKYAALLDEMGCGKSFQIASTIALLLQNHTIDRCLIVCPKSLVHTWIEELKLATNIAYQVISGAPQKRAQALQSNASIFIIHYEGLRLEKEALGQWLEGGNGMLVFDESQRIKNLYAQTTIAARHVRKFAKRCVIATGTPISNRPLDLFAQYYVMDEGATFGNNFQSFKNTFCILEMLEIPQGRRKIRVEKFLGIKNGEELQKRIKSTSLRRLKTDVLDLPPIIFKDYLVEMKDEQKSLYMKVRDNVRSEIQSLSEAELRKQASFIMVRLIRLCQIASNPKLLDPHYDGVNAKWTELDDIVDDVFSDDTKKIIIWSHFVENVEFLTEKYKDKYGAVSHTGSMNTNERAHSVKEFQENPACRLFIATPQSAKEGLTLLPTDGVMKADTMIYADLNFDSGSYVQSQARFHRIGQESEKCLVIHLIAQDSIDEHIKKTILEKIQTATTLLDEKSLEDLDIWKTKEPVLDKETALKILDVL